jgi:RNA polymerase primary sigma factor
VARRFAATGGDQDTLSAYLREIARLPRLTTEQERELGRRIQRDQDEYAIGRLVESNLRFVVSYAKRYRGLGVSLLDLIHEGNLGLFEAARRFDPARNVKFMTYAVWWVRESMMHLLADQSRAFSFPPKLFPLLHGATMDASLNERLAARDREPGDSLSQEWSPSIVEAMIRQADLDELTAALHDLDGQEREIVRLRFGLEDEQPRTLREIGDRMHLSRERVRQIESRAKDKLRRSARLRSCLN